MSRFCVKCGGEFVNGVCPKCGNTASEQELLKNKHNSILCSNCNVPFNNNGVCPRCGNLKAKDITVRNRNSSYIVPVILSVLLVAMIGIVVLYTVDNDILNADTSSNSTFIAGKPTTTTNQKPTTTTTQKPTTTTTQKPTTTTTQKPTTTTTTKNVPQAPYIFDPYEIVDALKKYGVSKGLTHTYFEFGAMAVGINTDSWHNSDSSQIIDSLKESIDEAVDMGYSVFCVSFSDRGINDGYQDFNIGIVFE